MLKSLFSLLSDLDDVTRLFANILLNSGPLKKTSWKIYYCINTCWKASSFCAAPCTYKYPENEVQLPKQIQTSSQNAENCISVNKVLHLCLKITSHTFIQQYLKKPAGTSTKAYCQEKKCSKQEVLQSITALWVQSSVTQLIEVAINSDSLLLS